MKGRGPAVLLVLLAGCVADITYEDGAVPGADLAEESMRDRPGDPPDGQVAACQPRETYHDGHCYFTTGLGQVDYPAAKALCAATGAKPASIRSAEENRFVFSLLFHVSSAAWIGLVRSPGKPFKWQDGTSLTYTNWDAGEPSGDDCAVMVGPFGDKKSHGMWKDRRCSSWLREVVCKRRP